MIIHGDRGEDAFFVFPKSRSKIRIALNSDEPLTSGREVGDTSKERDAKRRQPATETGFSGMWNAQWAWPDFLRLANALSAYILQMAKKRWRTNCRQKQAFLVCGTHSGCGKTTVALGLLAALRARGLSVQPFKVGPDFIDPGLHTQIAGKQSRNLDGWMLSRRWNEELFRRLLEGSDVGLIEGVMGLFDGYEGQTESGSSAEMAKWLEVPAVLVVDARSMARSAAALIYGFMRFRSGAEFCRGDFQPDRRRGAFEVPEGGRRLRMSGNCRFGRHSRRRPGPNTRAASGACNR